MIENRKIYDASSMVVVSLPITFESKHDLFCRICGKILTLSVFDKESFDKFGVCEKCSFSERMRGKQ